MPRLILPIYSDFYWKPLTEDVEELLSRFQQADTVRYDVFSAIWRKMGFSEVFLGIKLMTEMKRFCRVALSTAVKYFLPPYSYQIQVGALYLMYAFYHTQLAIPRVKIRVALKEWPHFQKFLQDSVNAQHYDAVYIFRKLFVGKATHYTAMPHLLSFRKQRKTRRDPVCQEFLGRSTRVQDLLSWQRLQELSNIQSHYERLRGAVAERSGLPSMVQRDLPARLYRCASWFIAWQENAVHPEARGDQSRDGYPPASSESSARAQLLSAIKGKSYGSYQSPSKARRHRQVDPRETASPGTELGGPLLGKGTSLRARTERSLRVQESTTNVQCWLLSAPEQDRLTLKRNIVVAPLRMSEEE